MLYQLTDVALGFRGQVTWPDPYPKYRPAQSNPSPRIACRPSHPQSCNRIRYRNL